MDGPLAAFGVVLPTGLVCLPEMEARRADFLGPGPPRPAVPGCPNEKNRAKIALFSGSKRDPRWSLFGQKKVKNGLPTRTVRVLVPAG